MNKKLSSRMANVESKMQTKQKKIKFVVNENLPKKLDDDKFYIHVAGVKANSVEVSTDGESLATIQYKQCTREDIEQEIRDLGFNPELLKLDEHDEDEMYIFKRHLMKAHAQGKFVTYPGGKHRAEFVFEMPEKPDDNVFYILVETEEPNRNK